MATLLEAAAIALGGGGTTIFAQAVGSWWAAQREDKRFRLDHDAKLEEHRDSLTFDLLNAGREEMAPQRAEASSLRSLMVHAAQTSSSG